MAVRILPMSHSHYKYNKHFIQNFVDHPVGADANSAESAMLPFEGGTRMWPFGQAVDGLHDPNPMLLRNACQFLGRAALNLN